MVAILILLTILTFLTLDYFVQREVARRNVPDLSPVVAGIDAVSDLPPGLFVGPGHVWLGIEPDGRVTLGADRLPAALLGGLDRVETVAPGSEVRRGDTLAVLHRGSRVLPLAAPVDGVVGKVNPFASAHPDGVSTDPFGGGWLCTLSPRNLAAGLKNLRVAEEAGEWMRSELSRLRDFLTGVAGQGSLATATLPDGGLPVAGVAAHLGDAEWAELTERFFVVTGGLEAA